MIDRRSKAQIDSSQNRRLPHELHLVALAPRHRVATDDPMHSQRHRGVLVWAGYRGCMIMHMRLVFDQRLTIDCRKEMQFVVQDNEQGGMLFPCQHMKGDDEVPDWGLTKAGFDDLRPQGFGCLVVSGDADPSSGCECQETGDDEE